MNTSEKLAILGGDKSVDVPKPHYVWPEITDRTREAVLKQLDSTISIYNKSDIFERFENNFAKYHGRKYALLHNSGTNAIWSMFVGCDLQPGDEVICPTYTFHATATLLLQTGATPIFVDAKEDGNIDPEKIRAAITKKTKAIIITHMWGIPCDMDEIVAIAKEAGVYLLEDCSHAHGAEYKGRKVGTFGDAAAWSLQGQKTVTGGEGGIVLTDNEEIHIRELLLGHYNKRCTQEIPKDHRLRQFALTGFGLKNRAHPLAIAIAQEQFERLDSILEFRRRYAEMMMNELGGFEEISLPNTKERLPSWYAFTIQYHEEKAGVKIEKFYQALQAEGLAEADRPGSTGPIHDLPLFQNRHIVYPHLYRQTETTSSEYPQAVNFWKKAIKFPVWHRPEDEGMTRDYIKGVKKVLTNLPSLKDNA